MYFKENNVLYYIKYIKKIIILTQMDIQECNNEPLKLESKLLNSE